VHGVVVEFDEAAGLGAVDGDDGTRYDFHCVEIADGTRAIPVGAHVTFRPLPKLGRIEAAALERP
jgi:CspA family cold shock protein